LLTAERNALSSQLTADTHSLQSLHSEEVSQLKQDLENLTASLTQSQLICEQTKLV